MKKNFRIHHTKDYSIPRNYLYKIQIILISLFVISCQKEKKTDEILITKFGWEPGISAPKYYPVGGVKVDFGNAGHGSITSFENGWGEEYGGVVSGDEYKEIPKEVYISYISAVDNLEYKGVVKLDQEKILHIFRSYCKRKSDIAHLTVGMAPGGWIRVWFNMMTGNDYDNNSKLIHIEIAKSQLKGYEDNTIGEGFRYKKSEYWNKYKNYWQHHGIPYEAWANNEKEYDIIFDFDKPDYRKVGLSYISADGTFYQRGGERVHQKLPVQFEPITWLGKSNTVYECNVPMPRNFKIYIEQKKLKEVRLKFEIENDDQHAVIYLITNDSKEKIMRFRNKIPTAEEKKNNDYSNATEVEYFIP